MVALNKRFGSSLRWFVAQGQAQWMRNNGCENVTELSWWEEDILSKNGKDYKFACTPSQHWCKRTPRDTNKVRSSTCPGLEGGQGVRTPWKITNI